MSRFGEVLRENIMHPLLVRIGNLAECEPNLPETVRAPRSSVTRVRTLTQSQLTRGIRLARSSTERVEAKRPRPASAALLDEEPVSRGRRSAASTDRQLCLPALDQSTPSSIRRSAPRLPASCLPARFARRASGRGSTTTVAFCSRSGTESLHVRTLRCPLNVPQPDIRGPATLWSAARSKLSPSPIGK